MSLLPAQEIHIKYKLSLHFIIYGIITSAENCYMVGKLYKLYNLFFLRIIKLFLQNILIN